MLVYKIFVGNFSIFFIFWDRIQFLHQQLANYRCVLCATYIETMLFPLQYNSFCLILLSLFSVFIFNSYIHSNECVESNLLEVDYGGSQVLLKTAIEISTKNFKSMIKFLEIESETKCSSHKLSCSQRKLIKSEINAMMLVNLSV